MATTGTGDAHYIHLRLFLEGIEVPVIGASVNVSVNMPATATIQIVPSDRLSTLLPRTTVHLFFFDPTTFSSFEPDDHDYKLMFCGEVFDISFAKSGHGSRSVTLRCMDFSNVWDTNYSYIMRYAVGAENDPNGSALVSKAGFIGGGGLTGPNPFDDIVNNPADVIRQMALSAGGANPSLPGRGSILGGLLSILELLSGVQGIYMGINPWATIEERRCRVLDSIVSDNGATARNLFDQQVFADWLQQRTGTAGSVISFRQIINMICQYIYYDVVTNVTPVYVQGNDGEGRPGRLPPEYVQQGLSASFQANAALNVEEGAELLRGNLDNVVSFPTSLIRGLDQDFWVYVQELVTKMNEFCGSYAVPYANPGGVTMKFALTSGLRSIEDSMRLGNRTREEAIRTAHVMGYAIDISPVFPGRQILSSGLGYKLESDWTSPVNEIPDSDIKKNMITRFRAAIYKLHSEGRFTPVNGGFETLYGLIKNDQNLLQICFDDLETLDRHANSFRNECAFYKTIFSPAVQAVNQSTSSGVTGQWGGGSGFRQGCPLFMLFGIHWDPVHVQDAGFRSKTPTRVFEYQAPTQTITEDGVEIVREQLKSFIFRPNIWFSPPPVCNVLYPHMYESMSVSRQMMRETTRLQLDAFNQFYESVILSSYYYAPKFSEGNHVTGSGLGSVTKTVLMDHEVFSGIVPKMERISEITFYVKSSGEINDPNGQGLLATSDLNWTQSDIQSSPAASTIANYGDRVAHFNLLTNRYSARTGSVNGPFNPYLVCGFPAVIINELPSYSSEEKSEVVNTIIEGSRHDSISKKVQWLGMITSIDHSITQEGARTSASLGYVRSHRVGDDTDDLLSESVTDQGSFVVQDPNYRPDSVGTINSHNFASTISIGVAEIADPENSDYLWIFKLVAKTTGVDFPELLTGGKRIDTDVQDPLAEVNAATGSADFSENGQALQSVSGVTGPGGQLIRSARWIGDPVTVVVLYEHNDFSSNVPLVSNISELADFPPAGKLSTLTIKPIVQDSAAFGNAYTSLVDGPNWVSFVDVPIRSVTTRGAVTPGIKNARVPIRLPGSELEVEFFTPGSRASDRVLPIEEAIRPPWIDKDSYSSEDSGSGRYTSKLDELYIHLFGSPSIIRQLLLCDATPYDNMDIHSVEQAVDYIVCDVGLQAVAGGERVRDSFVSALTARPIATLPEVLAPKGFLPDESGRWRKVDLPSDSDSLQVSGGYHSNAVAGYNYSRDGSSVLDPDNLQYGANLEFLDLEGNLGSRLHPDAAANLLNSVQAHRADPRAPRARRIAEYVLDINGTSSLRQTGFGSRFKKTPSGKGKKG